MWKCKQLYHIVDAFVGQWKFLCFRQSREKKGCRNDMSSRMRWEYEMLSRISWAMNGIEDPVICSMDRSSMVRHAKNVERNSGETFFGLTFLPGNVYSLLRGLGWYPNVTFDKFKVSQFRPSIAVLRPTNVRVLLWPPNSSFCSVKWSIDKDRRFSSPIVIRSSWFHWSNYMKE